MAEMGREDGRECLDDVSEDRQALRAARGALGLARFVWSEERIAGKIHRLELKRPRFKRRCVRKESAVPRRPRMPRPAKRSRRGASELMAAFYALGLDQFFGAPDTRTVHQHAGKAFGAACGLLDLTAATCRWPVGEPGEADFAFCGAAPFRRYPYCVGHCLIAYRPESQESEVARAAKPPRRDQRVKHAA